MKPILDRLRSAALTYPQVLTPKLASALVRSITSGSSSKKAQGSQRPSGGVLNSKNSPGLNIGSPGERYAPPAPSSGRTNGILAAQAAAAPLPGVPVDQQIKGLEG